MGLKFDCPACGQRLNVSETVAGKRGICPHCQNKIQIPQESTERPTVPAAVATAAVPAPASLPVATAIPVAPIVPFAPSTGPGPPSAAGVPPVFPMNAALPQVQVGLDPHLQRTKLPYRPKSNRGPLTAIVILVLLMIPLSYLVWRVLNGQWPAGGEPPAASTPVE